MINLLKNLSAKNSQFFVVYFVLIYIFLISYTFFINSESNIRAFLLSADFRAFYTAGSMLRNGQIAHLYTIQEEYKWQQTFAPELQNLQYLMPFRNPPFVAAVFLPFAFLPYPTAYFLWTGINFGVFIYLLHVIFDLLPVKHFSTKSIIGLSTLAFYPIWITITIGQVSLFITLAFLAAFRSIQKKELFTAGCWLALLLIKPQYLLIPIIFLVWKKQWSILSGLIFFSIILTVISILTSGISGLYNYFISLIPVFQMREFYSLAPDSMHTIRGLITLIVPEPKNLQTFLWLISDIFLVLSGWYMLRKAKIGADSSISWAIIILLSILISPYTNFQDLSLIVAVFFIIWPIVYERQKITSPLQISFALFYFLLYIDEFLKNLLHLRLSVILLLVLLFNCFLLMQKAKAKGIPLH